MKKCPSYKSETLPRQSRIVLRELRRNQIAKRVTEAEHNYNAGNVARGTVNDLKREFEDFS